MVESVAPDSLLASLPVGIAAIVVALCLVTDLLWRRIPNVVTLPAAGVGLILALMAGGWKGLSFSAGGFVVGFTLMILPYYVGGMGAGDVKLMAALGALLGIAAIIQVFLYTALIGGVLAVVSALWKGTLIRALRNIVDWTTSLVLQGLAGVRGGLKDTQLAQTAGVIPYGVAIALGLYAYLAFGRII
ncbi:MAG TPA: A24 family peptidase [bacterium]|nr:A24 family peptidase [bacterium]